MAYKKTEHFDEDITSGLMDNYRRCFRIAG